MPKFIVLSSETIYYETYVEAEDEDKAREKFYDIADDENALVAYGSDHWKIDDVEEVKL